MLASSLLSEGYLQPAGDTSKAAAEGLSDTPFLDLSDAYYYFVSVVFWFSFVPDLQILCSSQVWVGILKSWRKECTELEIYVNCLYVALRIHCLTFTSVTKTVLLALWTECRDFLNLGIIPSNFSSDEDLATSSPDDSVERKRVIHHHGASQSGSRWKHIFVHWAGRSDSEHRHAHIHTELACEQKSKRCFIFFFF